MPRPRCHKGKKVCLHKICQRGPLTSQGQPVQVRVSSAQLRTGVFFECRGLGLRLQNFQLVNETAGIEILFVDLGPSKITVTYSHSMPSSAQLTLWLADSTPSRSAAKEPRTFQVQGTNWSSSDLGGSSEMEDILSIVGLGLFDLSSCKYGL